MFILDVFGSTEVYTLKYMDRISAPFLSEKNFQTFSRHIQFFGPTSQNFYIQFSFPMFCDLMVNLFRGNWFVFRPPLVGVLIGGKVEVLKDWDLHWRHEGQLGSGLGPKSRAISEVSNHNSAGPPILTTFPCSFTFSCCCLMWKIVGTFKIAHLKFCRPFLMSLTGPTCHRVSVRT